MPPKKKVTINSKPAPITSKSITSKSTTSKSTSSETPIIQTKNKQEDTDDDDKSSVSTDSDIMSGTFSQLDENEEPPEEIGDSDVESIEEEEEVEDTIEATEEEPVEEEAGDTETPKIKKKKGVKKAIVTSSDCLYNNIDFEEDYDEKEEQVEDSKRITINRLTKYERVRIIGIRAKQIMTGANILIKGVENKTPQEIAELEVKNNMVPFKIKRNLPNGKFEIWRLSELEK
jgi:DNA-directed RNA polymerase subunit K/omega